MLKKIILPAGFLGLILSGTEAQATGGTGFQEAEAGHAKVLDELKKMYEVGNSYAEELEWSEKATAGGTAPQQDKLGAMYDQVEDVDKPKEVIHEEDDAADLYD